MLLSGIYFLVLNKMGKLRVPLIYELVGLDYIEHGGPAAKPMVD